MLNYRNIFEESGLTYAGYRHLIDRLLAEGKTTGPDQGADMINYTRLNVQRMKRIDKTAVLSPSLADTAAGLMQKIRILVITEGWCGDAAQSVPVLNTLVTAAPDKLEMRLVLRDEHTELTDRFLTNGSRSIPIVLFLNVQGDTVLAKWGPRPVVLQELLAEWKKETSDKAAVAEKLHGWYAKDKTIAIQQEIEEILKRIKQDDIS